MNQEMAIPVPAKARGKIAPIRFAHVVYRTSRFAEMVNWYKTVLEAEASLSNEMLAFLTYDEEHHRVAIANMPGLEPAQTRHSGVEHVAYTFGSLDDLFATYERLKGENIEPYWCINHGPTLSMYYRDPDGNQVELQIDIFDSADATNEWFRNSDFSTNPIGVKFEPEDLISRYGAGESAADLLRRPRIDPAEVGAQFPDGGGF